MKGYGEFDIEIESHSTFHQRVKKVLDEEDWKSTKDIQSAVDMEEWTDKHIRSKLTYLRQYMEDQDEIELKTERHGGHPTYKWRLKVEE